MSDITVVSEQAGNVAITSVEEQVAVVAVGHQGPPGAPGPKGERGERGLPGVSGASFVHEQQVPAEEWPITHNLGRFPSVTVVDSAGSVVIGEVQYLTSESVKLVFSVPFSGKAYLN